MTLDLDAIEERCDRATPGPWAARDGRDWRARVMDANGYELTDTREEADAEFIAHARTDIPALVAALRRVEALADEWERDIALWGKKPSSEALVVNLRDLRAALKGDDK